MTAATVSPMGGVRSPQADKIRELYDASGATSMRRTALKGNVIRIALFCKPFIQPVQVWHVHPDNTARRQDVQS